jgi:nitroreductase
MNHLTFLDERTSIRNFDPDVMISDEEIQSILLHAVNAPSSYNAQPWKVFVVKNKEKQKILKEFTANAIQVVDASAIFLIFGDKSSYDVDKLINFNIEKGIIKFEDVDEHISRLNRYHTLHPEDKDNEGLKLDIGLFSMNLMHILRTFGYDSVPMRGMDFEKAQDYLGISKELLPILLLPVGKAMNTRLPHIRKTYAEFARIIS